MYARVTSYHAKPGALKNVSEIIENVAAKVKTFGGVVSSYDMWGDDGHGMTVTIFDSKAAADAAGERVRNELWPDLEGVWASPPVVQGYGNVSDLLA